MAARMMASGASGLTAHRTTMKLIMEMMVLIIEKVEVAICSGRWPASRLAFSSFS